MQYNAMQCNTMQRNARQYSVMQCNASTAFKARQGKARQQKGKARERELRKLLRWVGHARIRGHAKSLRRLHCFVVFCFWVFFQKNSAGARVVSSGEVSPRSLLETVTELTRKTIFNRCQIGFNCLRFARPPMPRSGEQKGNRIFSFVFLWFVDQNLDFRGPLAAAIGINFFDVQALPFHFVPKT